MLKRWYIWACLLFWINSSCQNDIAIDNIQDVPSFQEKDNRYKDVFVILDGTWKGEFLIYEDLNPISKDAIDLNNISLSLFKARKLKQVNQIEVTQVYTSETPYFQRVEIIDFYPDTKQKVVSKGVNKIQDGNMWCVVKKPDETVIHKGTTEGENTIIWQRNERNPQKIEYFKETVSPKFYEIIGWGYYEGDDTNLSPKLWFYAKYERQ
ncbi:hypothetical protein M0D21_18375 [Aquimarina sp. D1M17]|uniref:hypothetical protein n=1 Tax=Aquimarina acroporae TaxID=2937283 RepID=UPI0020C084CC|nr:hypothetical protein [Aquimarina acroporae]MCK8523556.1 hypothetical protein [Aquimarina acroporae]